jgi:hypothetical protein
MTGSTSQELFRQAAETEDGMSVSAGARVAHLRHAIETGRAFYLDLTGVPEHLRATLIAEIKELVKRAAVNQPPASPQPAAKSGI